MKAISLWQPWASAIAAGLKTIETRHWATVYRGPLAIHAAKRWTKSEREFWMRQRNLSRDGAVETMTAFQAIGIHDSGDLPVGCVVATCEVYDCLSTSSDSDAEKLKSHQQAFNEYEWGNYSEGRFAWLLRNVKPLAVPVPCVGRQGFFDWQPPTPGESG